MANPEEKYMTPGEMFEKYGVELTPKDFVRTIGPCENPNLFLPFPEVPTHLMDPEKAAQAKELLSRCTTIVGIWGYLESKREDEDYKKASSAFKELTGVDVWDILIEARSQLENRQEVL